MKVVNSDAELEHLKDEEYLIIKAKEEKKKDILAAKCWLITAQTIYPQNFGILLEIYSIAKQEKNLHEAANGLKTMFQNFSHEPALWGEIDSIMEQLCEPSPPNSSSFLSQIFAILPKGKSFILYIISGEA